MWKQKRVGPPKACEWCGSDFLPWQSQWTTARFCSRSCSAKNTRKISPALRGEANPKWTANPTYDSLHGRVHRARGKAAEHSCVDCGEQAQEWSYTHGKEPSDVGSYEPRCIRCHRLYDENPVAVGLYRPYELRRGSLWDQ